ncbi:hotdog domain-containing protein [Spirillospora sp. NPDC029432]|uniref:thioesterase family protein n=1 Tax=Spirillospora sp. NPDC029432 TaxID=3154599 RepID=UPI00345239B5
MTGGSVVEIGDLGEVELVVGPEDTAERVGSGDLPVLGTPRLLAVMEEATVRAVQGRLGDGRTSVGTRVELEHLAASPVGARVAVVAELAEVAGRRLVFGVRATDQDGTEVGRGRVERAVVDRERFMARLG